MEDTASKHNLSVKSESVANHHLKTILNPNYPEFEPYSEHKTGDHVLSDIVVVTTQHITSVMYGN